eukprot:CAMPEP_0184346192 /NCGR_PEP_ID=MMETSP1089-20130417/14489_1 /TAXON_ID=38269 ORGANISM="Gloeochaete wittrockiana, Strain SAG46.84" /NCGR_SAMPLE_ID=MMETSP1089 /ASSEMBLY_ACC=CAM_ASM_000445 /LENGTH=315 /DNA_ID=CAMNT_0026676767 /DNA_START=171 /DNA_END=1118 /DNA_ORIENTATION=-
MSSTDYFVSLYGTTGTSILFRLPPKATFAKLREAVAKCKVHPFPFEDFSFVVETAGRHLRLGTEQDRIVKYCPDRDVWVASAHGELRSHSHGPPAPVAQPPTLSLTRADLDHGLSLQAGIRRDYGPSLADYERMVESGQEQSRQTEAVSVKEVDMEQASTNEDTVLKSSCLVILKRDTREEVQRLDVHAKEKEDVVYKKEDYVASFLGLGEPLLSLRDAMQLVSKKEGKELDHVLNNTNKHLKKRTFLEGASLKGLGATAVSVGLSASWMNSKKVRVCSVGEAVQAWTCVERGIGKRGSTAARVVEESSAENLEG